MAFDTQWLTLGKHRVRLHSTRGFPTETLRTVADLARLAIENNMSARARLVEVVYRDQDKAYDVFVGTTMSEDAFARHSWKWHSRLCLDYCRSRSP